ncbi:MOXD2 protein, partial [Grallaria varia]|nr:MOXD2 protein [Grallaria varia]
VAMSFSRIHGMFFLLFLPCFCSPHPAAPLLHFSTFLDPSHLLSLCWDHDKEELVAFELQIRAAGRVAFGFSPCGELPESDIVMGVVFLNGSICFSVR